MAKKLGSTSVAANSNSGNVLNNTRIMKVENEEEVYAVRLLGTGSATGLEVELYAGKMNLLERSILSTQNRVPIDPDDVLLDWTGVPGGTDLQLTFYNGTAGALTAFYTIEVVPASELGG